MFELNGQSVTLDFLQERATENNMDFDSYLAAMKEKGLVEIEAEQDNDSVNRVLGMFDKGDELPMDEQQEEIEEPISIYGLIKDIPSRQDDRIAAVNDQMILKGQDEKNKQELFEEFKTQHGTEDPVEALTNQYDKNVFMEKVGGDDITLPFPENPTGFLLNDPDFWSNTNNREQHRQFYINKRSSEERVNFEKKFATKEDVDNAIILQGDNYISLEDMDIAKLRRDGKEDEANKLAKDRGYVQLLDNEGNLKGWIPSDIEDSAQQEGGSKDKDVLEEQRRQAYFKLIAASKLAHENTQPGTHPYLNTLGDVSIGKSLIHNIRDLFGDDTTMDDVMTRLEDINSSSELVAGLHKLPSKTATARTFNNALDEFVTMNRALEINADLSKLKEENFFKEIVAPTNDKIVENFTGMMEANGYEMSPDALNRAPSDWGQRNGLNVFGDNTKVRDIVEGGRDVASHLAPLAASVWLTKKLPVGGKEKLVKVGDKMKKVFEPKTFGRALDQRTNILGRYLKNAGPQSRVYKNAIDLTLGGIKETVVLGMADVPAGKIFGSDPFVYNPKTDEFTPTFPFALGFGNAAAAKILNKLNTTKNFFTPALATINRSGTAQAALEANIGATVGTATMFFAEEITKGVDNWQNLGYESEEEMKQDHGFKNLVETYIGMLMFQSVSPAMGQNALSKLGRGMHSDIMRATTGLTPRARKAMKFFGIEKNEKGEFNLQEVKNAEGQKIYEVSKDKKLTETEKKQEIEKIKNQAEELIFHNELKLAKELAKGEGKYREYLTNTFDIANKLKTGKRPTAEDIQRFNNLTDVEFSWLKKKFGVTENSDFSRMLDNKREVYKDIVERVDEAWINSQTGKIEGRMFESISPEARNKQIELYLKQAEMAGEIQMLAKQVEKSPHLKAVNAEKIKKIQEKQKLNAEELVKNEELYDKMLKEKFETEVQFSKLMAKELGAGFNLVGEDVFVNRGGTKGSEGFFNRETNQVYINRDRALEVRQLGTPLHEVTHAILKNSLKESYVDSEGVERTRVSKEGMTKINQFLNQLTSKERSAVEKRMEKEYKYYRDSNGNFILKDGEKIARPKEEYAEEYLTAFGDVLKNKEVIETPDLASRISNFFTPIMRQAGFKNMQVTAENGKGLYNMIKAIQKSSETGIIDRDVLNIAKTSKAVTGKAIAESRTITEGMKEASADIDRIYKEKGLEGYNEIIERIKGKDAQGRTISKDFIKQYTEIYRDHAGYESKKDILYDAMANDPTYGVLGSIMKYDASKGTTMSQHILGRLKQGKHIDVANLILGKDAQRQFTKKLDAPEAMEVEAKQLTAEELTDIALAKEKIQQAPNLRKSLVKGEKKGIDQELIDKIEATVVKTFGTKTLKPEAKGFRKSIENSYKIELKKPIADLMGKGPEYEVFLRENFDAIMKHIDKSFFVQMERLTPRKDRIFTEVEIESMSTKQTDKAIAEGRVPKNTSRTAGNTLWKFKKPAPAQFLKFYTGAGLGSTKGTRKDRLAEVLGIEMAKDFTSEILSRPEIAARVKEVSLLELERSIEGTGKTSPKIAEAKEMLFDNYVERVAAQIGRDPNMLFSQTAFKKEVKELKALVKKAELFGDVFDVKTSKPLVKRADGTEFSKDAYTTVLDGYWNNLLDFNVTRYKNKLIAKTGKKSTTKGTAYEYYTEDSVKKQLKALGLKGDVKVTSEVTEKQIYLDPQGNFKGGKVQAPDFVIDWNGTKQTWELKYKSARTPKNSAGFINYTQSYKNIVAGKEFKLTERKSPRKNPKEEAIFVESVKQAILNGVPQVEKVLRDRGILKKGEDFTTRTKIPLDVHLLINGKEKALMADASQKINGDWVAADYNKKGVNIFQMATKGAFYLGSDWTGMAKEAGATKLETNAPLVTRVYSSSYKKVIDGKEVTAGYTYNLVGEGVITPKNITSKSTLNLDSPGAIKKMANTPSAKRIKRMAKAEATAFKVNKEIASKTGVLAESRTNKELIEKAKMIDKALELGAKRNKKSRGMSTFDFDETLIDKGKNFIVAREPNTGKKVKISSGNWPIEGPKFAEQGYTFDFSDFVKVRGGVEGPMFKKFKERLNKFGPDNMYILTARPPEAATAIYGWLKSKGVEIPFKNITGLGNSKGEAKAEWMLKKFSEGYNDMYFVDDALPNVKAVKDVLNQLDIKSDVQLAYSKTNLNKSVNKIMEHSLDIGSEKVFSKAEAKVRGKDIKRRRVFMRDSAADLELLIEPLYGKGKEGIKNKKWFKKEFVMPFERGIRDYNTARQSAKNDYMNLRKQNKDVVKDISKEVEGTTFTNDMAMRVYLWNKAGYKIPDLAKTTETKLVEHIRNNPKLQAYAERFATITKQEKGLKEPGQNWWAETMAGEVTNINRGVSRKQYLQEWVDVKNEIFTEANLNKMESKLGTEWRENITDMFDRMETGRTRSLKMDRGSAMMMNYLNGSIGSIMNFNTRSAALQTISTVNFLNMRENNPIAAARAMGNTKQFVKDFKYIMNSDMLKQRRDGLAMNVTEAELASAAAGSKNPIQSMIAKVLKHGYLPTKMADSFAISFGGATFYRNRIKMYEKQGMTTKEAEKQAWLDFQVLSERTQQSSRADLLSKQQTSLIGRFILPFANTPMQMNRAGMKDILDISKGRYKNKAELGEKMGRITYYMGAQIAIFAGLQSGMFALMLNEDDVPEKTVERAKTYALGSTTDSFLRGFGVQGALLSAFKNAAIQYAKQSAKPGFSADYGEVGEALLNISPPIGSKFGKLDRAGDMMKWAKIRKEDEFKFKLGNPSLEAGLLTIEAITNAPLHGWHQNAFNIKHALSDDYEMWQRAHMLGGWTPFQVGIEYEKKKKKIKTKKKTKKKKRKSNYRGYIGPL
jgi:hypothetical protein